MWNQEESTLIPVTGATGRTGSEAVKALIAKGEQVQTLAPDPQRAGAIQGPGVKLIGGAGLAQSGILGPYGPTA